MLSLIWESSGDLFAFAASQVVEVLPMVEVRRLPAAPAWALGLADHHGRLVPVVEGSMLVQRPPAAANQAARVVVISLEALGGAHHAGILVPRVVSVERVDFAADSGHPGFRVEGAEHLGEVARLRDGSGQAGQTVQMVRPERLLGGEVASVLFKAAAEAR